MPPVKDLLQAGHILPGSLEVALTTTETSLWLEVLNSTVTRVLRDRGCGVEWSEQGHVGASLAVVGAEEAFGVREGTQKEGSF